MSAEDIVAGKAGFQRADLMDYGSLYGMRSYFGQDYTAFALMCLANLTEDGISEISPNQLISPPKRLRSRPPSNLRSLAMRKPDREGRCPRRLDGRGCSATGRPRL